MTPIRHRRGLTVGLVMGVVAVAVAVILILVVARPGSGGDGQESPATTAPSQTSAASPTSTGSPVPPSAAPEAPPTAPVPVEVAIEEPAEPIPGVVVRVSAVESVEGEASPGELAGPALRVTVSIENTSGAEVDLSSSTINLTYGQDATPAPPVSGPGEVALPTSLSAGQSTSGIAVFTVPVQDRDRIGVTVDLSATAPIVVFVGRGPA